MSANPLPFLHLTKPEGQRVVELPLWPGAPEPCPTGKTQPHLPALAYTCCEQATEVWILLQSSLQGL